ncbi:MAG: Wadjet anti-phage system protein JetA family protein [Pseudomonadota bacterium]
MFFTEKRLHFFRPLSGKYREQAVACLRLFYIRMYTSLADYGNQLSRTQIIEIFQEAIIQAPSLDDENILDNELSLKTEREVAGFILNRLVENGWIEQHFDEGTMQSAYRLTRSGRLFTQPLVDSDLSRFRTKHRNTRNTKNALIVFSQHGEIHDLVDAWEFSERIISDFTDLIVELEDRKRDLIKDVEQQILVEQATEKFFDYMDKRFQPDVAVRLSADNIEKHKDDIIELIKSIRRKRKKDFKLAVEKRLRATFPDLIQDPKMSLLMLILDDIENRVKSASEKMLPEVRRALQSYTNRADIIIRQMTFLASQRQESLNDVCKNLSQCDPQTQDKKLLAAGAQMLNVKLGFIDPGNIKIRETAKRRVLDNRLTQTVAMSQEARKETFIREALEKAFMISSGDIQSFLIESLKAGHSIQASQLPINNAQDFLRAAHAIEAITAIHKQSEYRFEINWHVKKVVNEEKELLFTNKQQVSNEFYRMMDEYTIRFVENSGV